jgi:hypothetical protein
LGKNSGRPRHDIAGVTVLIELLNGMLLLLLSGFLLGFLFGCHDDSPPFFVGSTDRKFLKTNVALRRGRCCDWRINKIVARSTTKTFTSRAKVFSAIFIRA